jgi:hypothetical protein
MKSFAFLQSILIAFLRRVKCLSRPCRKTHQRTWYACAAVDADGSSVEMRDAMHLQHRFLRNPIAPDRAWIDIIRTRIQCRSKFLKIDVISVAK